MFGEFAETAADFVVFAVAGEIFEQENAFVLDGGDVGESGLGRLGVVDGSTVESGKAKCDAPCEERDAEIGGDFEEQLFNAVFFGGLDGEDRMTRIDEKAEIVALCGVGGRVEFGG